MKKELGHLVRFLFFDRRLSAALYFWSCSNMENWCKHFSNIIWPKIVMIFFFTPRLKVKYDFLLRLIGIIGVQIILWFLIFHDMPTFVYYYNVNRYGTYEWVESRCYKINSLLTRLWSWKYADRCSLCRVTLICLAWASGVTNSFTSYRTLYVIVDISKSLQFGVYCSLQSRTLEPIWDGGRSLITMWRRSSVFEKSRSTWVEQVARTRRTFDIWTHHRSGGWRSIIS